MPANAPVPEDDFVRLRVRLGQLRREKGFTYHDLAAESGVSRSTIVALETGKPRNGKPQQGSVAVWRQLARALGLPLSELLKTLD